MAVLDSDQRDELLARVMRWWSRHDDKSIQLPRDLNKTTGRVLVGLADEAVNASEVDFRGSIPPSATLDWLIANPEIPRHILIITEQYRKEVFG